MPAACRLGRGSTGSTGRRATHRSPGGFAPCTRGVIADFFEKSWFFSRGNGSSHHLRGFLVGPRPVGIVPGGRGGLINAAPAPPRSSPAPVGYTPGEGPRTGDGRTFCWAIRASPASHSLNTLILLRAPYAAASPLRAVTLSTRTPPALSATSPRRARARTPADTSS